MKDNWQDGAAWIQGELMPVAKAKIPVTDWGLTHSDITYDVVHAWDGRFFRLDDYLNRFEQSMRSCRLSVEQSRDDIRQILHQIVSRSGLRHAYVSFVASRGQPVHSGSRDPRDCANHFYAWCVPFVWVFNEEMMERGVRIQVPEHIHRIGETSVDPEAKNYHWGDFTQALIDAKDEGFDNTVLVDAQGNVTEGPGFNVFMIRDGQVGTPRSGVVQGVTRKVAMELCGEFGLEVVEKDISMEELFTADEVFATTTGGGIIPITQINERSFSNDRPGEHTLALQSRYWEWHKNPDMGENIDYSQLED